jgi:CO/xanthine dehydrogenase FAD-binding subunit
MARYDYHRPRTLQEASRLHTDNEGSRFIGGGTDVMVRIRRGTQRAPALISLRGVEELSGIELGETTRIGAMTLIGDIVAHPGLRERFGVLCDAAGKLGSEQIRNAATIGGNLCNASPCADTAPALLVLEAAVRVWGPSGMREVPLVDFFGGPGQARLARGEMLHSVLLRDPPKGARAVFQKKGRVAMDLATASVAALMQMKDTQCVRARLAAGSVAPVPLRLQKVEALLEGKEITSDVIAEARALAEQSVSPITDVRSTAEYRRHIVGVYTQRAIETLAGGRS